MKSLSRSLSLVALVAWGALMLYFYFSGRINEYLIPAYRPLVAVSGFLMLLIAGCLGFTYVFGQRFQLVGGAAIDDCPDDFASPGKVRATQVLSFVLLVVPIWSAVGVSKDGFTAAAVLNRGIVSDASNLPGRRSSAPIAVATNPVVANANNANLGAIVEPPLPGATPQNDNASNNPLDASQYLKTTPQGNVVAEVTDLLFAADDDTLRPAFENRSVEIIGQFMPTKDAPVANRFQLVRMFMVCCAADARPIAISVDPKSTINFPDMSWARVVGKVAFPVENGRRIPVVQAISAAKCDPPGELMLY